MKKVIIPTLILLSLICNILSPSVSHATDIILDNILAQVCFSPNGRCTEAIIKEIDNAKSEIFVQAYSFTSAPIAKALLNAHKKGIKVEVILDKSQRSERYTSARLLSNAGIPTYIDDKHTIAQNNIMIIDRETVITGSFNFTNDAEEKNAENLLIIKSKEFAKIYFDNWNSHKGHSEIYERR